MLNSIWKKSLLTLVISGALTACGGGSSDNSSADTNTGGNNNGGQDTETPAPTPPETPTPETPTPEPIAQGLELDIENSFYITDPTVTPARALPVIAENGNAAVMWLEESGSEVFAKIARYTRESNEWSPAVQVDSGGLNTYIPQGFQRPGFDIAMSDNLIAAIWHGDSDDKGVYLTTYTDNYGWQSNPTHHIPPYSTRYVDSDNMRIAVSKDGTRATAVWHIEVNYREKAMWTSTFSVESNSWSPATQFFEDGATETTSLIATDDGFFAAWVSNSDEKRGIRIARNVNGVWTEEQISNPEGVWIGKPALAETTAGVMVVGSNRGYVSQAIRTVNNGQIQWIAKSTPVNYETYTINQLDFEASANGKAHLLFTAGGPWNDYIVAEYDTATQSWNEPTRLASDMRPFPGAIDVDANGNALAFLGRTNSSIYSYTAGEGWQKNSTTSVSGQMHEVDVSQSGYGIHTVLNTDRGVRVTLTK